MNKLEQLCKNAYGNRAAQNKATAPKIDATAIIKGCNAVDNDANEISRLANLFKSEAARIDKTSLSIEIYEG